MSVDLYQTTECKTARLERSTTTEATSMRILFITSAFREGRVNQNHFQRIAILTEQSHLTILAGRGTDFSLSKSKGAEVVYARLPGKLGVLVESLWLAISTARWRYDLVITDPSVLGLCGVVMKLLARRKWVVDIWDIPIRSRDRRLWARLYVGIIRRLIKFGYRHADHFVVSILPDQELKWFRIPANKISTFTNAIWLDELDGIQPLLTETAGSNEILCMRSKYCEDSGLDTLSDAYSILTQQYPDVRLTIIGLIPKGVQPQVRLLKELPNVQLLKYLPYDQLLRRIAGAAVCVVPFKDVPDLAQTYPIKVFEYQGLGKPVVASSIGGLTRLITHGHNGLLFRPGDAADLAAKLSHLLANPALAGRLGEEGRNSDPNRNARVKGERIVALLRKIVAA